MPYDERPTYSFDDLVADCGRFTDERDWSRFHDPKSLILALVGEVGELAELFQWIPAEAAVEAFAAPDRKRRAEEEMSDVLIYLIGLARTLDIDLVEAARRKLSAAESRFPAADVRGVAPEKE